jgi:hypothetical protein
MPSGFRNVTKIDCKNNSIRSFDEPAGSSKEQKLTLSAGHNFPERSQRRITADDREKRDFQTLTPADLPGEYGAHPEQRQKPAA